MGQSCRLQYGNNLGSGKERECSNLGSSALLVSRFSECVPPFTHGVFYRVVRLTRPTVLREPYDAKSNLPSACSPPALGRKPVLCLAGMSGRLSLIVPCRYPLRHVSHGKPTVVKGGRWRLPCRCSLHRLSPRYNRTPLWARPLRN